MKSDLEWHADTLSLRWTEACDHARAIARTVFIFEVKA